MQPVAAIVVTCPYGEAPGEPASFRGFERMVYKSGGASIAEERRRFGALPPGAAVATGAGRLPARWVIHVAALDAGRRARPPALFAGLGAALRLGAMAGAADLALPLLGAGTLGDERAAGLVVTAWAAARRKPRETRLVVVTAVLAARLGAAWGLGDGGG